MRRTAQHIEVLGNRKAASVCLYLLGRRLQRHCHQASHLIVGQNPRQTDMDCTSLYIVQPLSEVIWKVATHTVYSVQYTLYMYVYM